MELKSYDPDGKNGEELAKLKKAFFASLPKSIKKKDIQFFRNDRLPLGDCHTTYFMETPFHMPSRLPTTYKTLARARVIHQLGDLMICLGTEINPNGITGLHDIGRTYTLEIIGKCEIIPYKHKTKMEYKYFKVYVYGRTIESAIQQFWEGYKRELAKINGVKNG